MGISLTRGETRFIVKVKFPHGSLTRFRSPMGSFGEDLRKERLARGFALEDISAVTKISQRHLIALEQERFRLLPGGILSKGIVRGYAGAIGLDPQDWTERFLQAYNASGQMVDEESGWTAFASNVGKARILRREAARDPFALDRRRPVAAGRGCRRFLDRALFRRARRVGGDTLLPMRGASMAFRGAWSSTRGLIEHLVSRI